MANLKRISRRSFVKTTLAGAVAAGAGRLVFGGEVASVLARPKIGEIKPVPSRAIEASPLSVGFEVLDRQRFEPEKTYPHLADLGVKWARCQTGWNRCERERGQFTFGWLDEVVDSLLAIGIQPWFNLGYGNKLYTPEKPDDMSVGWAPVFDEEAFEAWLRFTHRLAEHFGDRVRHWEIWNEPNITGFWKPEKPNAADYVRLLKPTAAEIRKQIPGAVIIGGAFAGIPMDYLKGCLEAGMADHVDKISYHPYRPIPEAGYDSQIAALRGLIAEYSNDIAIWQGENGCPSKGMGDSVGALSNLDWNEERQAKWLLRRILTDLRLEVELTSYFHTVDLVGYRGKTNYKGLLRGTEYTPKPAYHAYQNVCALFDSQTRHLGSGDTSTEGEEGGPQVATFARNGRALVAYWQPADLLKDWRPKRIALQVATDPDATLPDPVLADLLSGEVFDLEPAAEKENEQRKTFRNLPLLDYPLLIADRSTM